MGASFDLASPLTWVRCAIAAIWIVFGLAFKALNVVPRHRQIVARVLGERAAGPITLLVAIGETALGLWMLSGRWLVGCALVETLALVSMNLLELYHARDLLLSPRLMVMANVVLIALSWYVAVAPTP